MIDEHEAIEDKGFDGIGQDRMEQTALLFDSNDVQ